MVDRVKTRAEVIPTALPLICWGPWEDRFAFLYLDFLLCQIGTVSALLTSEVCLRTNTGLCTCVGCGTVGAGWHAPPRQVPCKPHLRHGPPEVASSSPSPPGLAEGLGASTGASVGSIPSQPSLPHPQPFPGQLLPGMPPPEGGLPSPAAGLGEPAGKAVRRQTREDTAQTL